MYTFLTVLISTILFLTMPESNTKQSISANQQVEKPIITFGVVADVQYADYNPGPSRYYRGSIAKLREAVMQFKSDSAEFIVSMGDLIDKDFDSFKPVLDILASSGLKTYHITGNHDFSVNNNQKNRLPLTDLNGARYYSFTKDKFKFIFLDGNDVSLYGATSRKTEQEANDLLTLMKSRGEKNALDWNGGIGSVQMNWLENELTAAEKNNEKVFLFCHFPISPLNAHNLLNYREVLELIGKYPGVKAWFAGHNHEGNYAKTGSIYHVTFKGMVETEKQNSFAIIRIYSNRIEINGYGREVSRILEY